MAASALVSEEALHSKILVVGAGGIGCELLKNLVLTGFRNIDVVDLDTIDVSNLNRQFLFQKKHVGMSKAKVASESVLRFASEANISPFHGSIMNPEFNVEYFKQYAVVLNALDNRAARSHVNRMCLAADVALVESGSAGYLGQVTVIKKGKSECYDCVPKGPQKTFPGCTIRNTPSEPIHCIVWAKHLFNQLFGEADIDEDVSPDMSDPELAKESANGTSGGGEGAGDSKDGEGAGGVVRLNTRKWAESNGHNPSLIFTKGFEMFDEDIEYLLTMENLWKKRRAPTPLKIDSVPNQVPTGSNAPKESSLRDKRVWSPAEARDVFLRCVGELAERTKTASGPLLWDKDDSVSLDFVTATANLRNYIFAIPLQSRFDVKSMAGNIIPAIATTNAMVAAMIVMEALKILRGHIDQCKSCFVVRKPNPRGKILVDMELAPPRPDCYVCSHKPEAVIQLNLNTMTVKGLEEKVIKGGLSFVAPDVNVEDGSGAVLISSEEGELAALAPKTLAEMKIPDGARLLCDDFMQQLTLRLVLRHNKELLADDFKVLSKDEQQLTLRLVLRHNKQLLADDFKVLSKDEQKEDVEADKEDGDKTEKVAIKRPVDITADHIEIDAEPAAKTPRLQ